MTSKGIATSRNPVFPGVYGLYVNRYCQSRAQIRHYGTPLVIGLMDRDIIAFRVDNQP
jgi:hypothetical protein